MATDRILEQLMLMNQNFNILALELRSINKRVNRIERTIVPRASTAGQEVANTFELLELILLQLPIGTLLLAQCVSKRFKAVIDGSEAI